MSTYAPKDWSKGEIVTDVDVDRWENGIYNAHKEIESVKGNVESIEMDILNVKENVATNNEEIHYLTSSYNSITTTTFENGRLTKIEEKEGDQIKNSTSLSYSNGLLSTINEISNGKTSVSVLMYTDGVLSSVQRTVS